MDRRSVITGFIGLGALAACSPGASGSGASAATTKIRFATDWKAQAEQGGFYQALATGLYAAKGLDVSIIAGGPAVNVPQLVAAGAVEMGMGSNSFIPLNIVKAGAPVRAVMASFQKDPQVLLTHPRDDIKDLADMKGKPVMLADASITAFWVWLKAKYGFTDAQVRKYTFNAAPFLADKTAIQQGYLTSEPYTIATKGGVLPKIFLLADYGYPSYGAMVMAPQSLIDTKPAAVKSFVDATIQGWTDYLFGDSTKGDAAIKKDNPDMDDATLKQAREKMVAYGMVGPTTKDQGGIGVMTEGRWKEFFDVMATAGVYPKDLDWKKAFTLQFVGGGKA
jgi:NitT/TauT family transport system substrate-binding protein